MIQETDKLAAELRRIANSLAGDRQFWVGLAGAPGSGKSTLAEGLKVRLGDTLAVIPNGWRTRHPFGSRTWCQLRKKVFDETWFMDIPVTECNRRVMRRHMKSGLTEEQARKKVKFNDSINAEFVSRVSPLNADRLIRLWLTIFSRNFMLSNFVTV